MNMIVVTYARQVVLNSLVGRWHLPGDFWVTSDDLLEVLDTLGDSLNVPLCLQVWCLRNIDAQGTVNRKATTRSRTPTKVLTDGNGD